MAFKMKGPSLYSSPITQKVDPDAPGTPGTPGYEPPVTSMDYLTKTPVGPVATKKPKKITSQDEESAYENAQNDYDTDNPTKAQLAKALRAIKNERSNKKRSDAERALEAKEDAMGL